MSHNIRRLLRSGPRFMHRHADARVVDLADHYSASCRLEQGEYVRCSLEEVPGGGTTRSNVNLPNRSSQ